MAGGGRRWFSLQNLTVLGAAAVTLLALGLLFASVIDLQPAATIEPAGTVTARTSAEGAGQPPDLSTMTPREAADRLFNRVMMADEQGDQDQVARFAPMAIAAYDRVEDLDLDAIYHIGLIHAAAGDVELSRDAVERMRAVVPEHLLASVLDHRLAIEADDQTAAERAVERFKTSYDSEIGVDRREYVEHKASIDLFREQIGMVAGSGSS